MKYYKLLVLLISIVTVITCCSDDGSSPDSSLTEIKIGALLPFTGSLGTYGESVLMALQFAVEDANKELAEKGKKITLVYDDTETDPDVTRILTKSHINHGVRIIIGPMASSNLIAIKEYINNSNSIVISPSSTAPELAGENDNIFRVIPDDRVTAKAIADEISSNGIDKLITIYKQDIWGAALNQEIKKSFEANGGELLRSASYYSTRYSEYEECFDAAIESIENVSTLDKIAVQLTSFEEGVNILEDAYHYSEKLRSVKWYGSDGMTQNSYILEVDTAVVFARAVNFTSPGFGLAESDAYTAISKSLENELGYKPSSLAILAYDALHVAAKTLGENKDDIAVSTLRTSLFNNMNGYEGASGKINLNSAGDRADGNYTFYRLNDSGTPAWIEKTP